MPSNKRHHYVGKSTRAAWKITEKAVTGLARWATADHTGTTKLLATMPPLGFFDTVCMVLIQLFFGILGEIGLTIYIPNSRKLPLALLALQLP